MVFYFRTRCGNYLLYMGRDKYENEDLIKYGQPEDVWFHVDDLSSAHVYLRMLPNQTLDDIPQDVLLDCGSLVKANSIQGCKRTSVHVIYTRWKNLKKTSDMVEGAVSYHRPDNVRRFEVHKNSAVVKQLEKTREERYPDLHKEQQDRLLEIQRQIKADQKKKDKEAQLEKLEQKRKQEELSYDRIMDRGNMTAASDMGGTVDATAAEEYEDDFF